MLRSIILIIPFLCIQCAIDRSYRVPDEDSIDQLSHFQSLHEQHRLQISEEGEPGQPLLLCLTFVGKEGGSPLADQRIEFYHTSHTGEYEPTNPEDESTARLRGDVRTNGNGEVYVKTILPGDYGSSHDNRHIHMTVPDARPEAYDIHFKQYSGSVGTNFIEKSDQHFLADLYLLQDSTLVTFLTIKVKNPSVLERQFIPACEWCGTGEAPEDIDSAWVLSPTDESGDRLILTGTVYQQDGRTPAPDVIIYAYHTNAFGIYPKRGNEKGNGVRHGYLRGWVKTNEKGRYRFTTIKPAAYPSRIEPAHVHMTLEGEEFDEYWIPSTLFVGDSLITQDIIQSRRISGDSLSIIELTQLKDGSLLGARDIYLKPPSD